MLYLDIDTDYLIGTKDIVGIFDLDNTTINPFTRNFLNSKQAENKVVYLVRDIPKSFVLTADGTVYIVEISSQVLKKRLGTGTV